MISFKIAMRGLVVACVVVVWAAVGGSAAGRELVSDERFFIDVTPSDAAAPEYVGVGGIPSYQYSDGAEICMEGLASS